MKVKLSNLIENCDIRGYDSDMKMVKGASMFMKNGIVYIKHYKTIIFAYDEKNNICEADLDCSMTSNRQISRALDHFGIPQASVINTHDGEKWNYSGSIYY